MKKILIDDIDEINTLFHFDVRDEGFVEKYGFPADIGPDSRNAEKTPKVFFSKGIKGVLNIIDVWIIWRMNRDHQNSDNWTEEFLTGAYLIDEKKKEITFDNMYEWLKQRKYYKIDLEKGIDYKIDDIDEAKESVMCDKVEKEKVGAIPWRFLFLYEMYNGKIKHGDFKVEDWNMHTISGKGISPEKITLIETSQGISDALSIIAILYERYNKKSEFRILGSFIEYCEKKSANFSTQKHK